MSWKEREFVMIHGMPYGKHDELFMEMFAPPFVLADMGLFDDCEIWPDIWMTFTVPFLWAYDWIENHSMQYDDFLSAYTIDDAQNMYECAYNEDVVINEYIELAELN